MRGYCTLFKTTVIEHSKDIVRYFTSQAELNGYAETIRSSGLKMQIESLDLDHIPNNSPQRPNQRDNGGSHRPIGR